jgi:DnaJ-class molecular chaperone
MGAENGYHHPNAGVVVVTTTRTIMTRGLGFLEPTQAICGDCSGKKFARDRGQTGSRHARRCQRCRGKGYTTVGRTKR